MPLVYRDIGKSGTQLDIVSGGAVLGRLWEIGLTRMANRPARWTWTWYAGPGSGPQEHGDAGTAEEAKAKLEEQWRAWLRSADLIER